MLICAGCWRPSPDFALKFVQSRDVHSAKAGAFRLGYYLANLTRGRVILWCYAIWYAVNVTANFDARLRLWLTSAGLSAIIGTALLISTRSSSRGSTLLDRWQVFRLYLMPFCVSSFSALVKDAGYILVFPPTVQENLTGLGLIAAFVLLVLFFKAKHRVERAPTSGSNEPLPISK